MIGNLIFHYRGGSTLFQNLIRDKECKYTGTISSGFFIPTDPPRQYHSIIITKPRNIPEPCIPRFYISTTDQGFKLREAVDLAPTIHLIRKPEDQISSLFYRDVGSEKKQREENPKRFFKRLCEGYANILKESKQLTNNDKYKIITFENLTTNTVDTIEQTFLFLGIEIDRNKVAENWERIRNNKKNIARHSTFSDATIFTNRNRCWEDWQHKIFQKAFK